MPFPDKKLPVVVMEDEETPPFKPSIVALQELIKALEAGNYKGLRTSLSEDERKYYEAKSS
jgi:hypothetical protein